MKSILNDVNRLEKGWEFLERLVAVAAKIRPGLENTNVDIDALVEFDVQLMFSKAFIEKIKEKENV